MGYYQPPKYARLTDDPIAFPYRCDPPSTQELSVSGGAKIPHVYRPDSPAAAAQKCVIKVSLSARVRAEGGGMKGVDLYARVRRAVYVEGLSQRGAARYFGIDPRTVAKMMRFSVPPGYRRRRPPARPKLDRFTGIIDQFLDDDASIAAKQRHTAKRIFERLRDEHGYGGLHDGQG